MSAPASRRADAGARRRIATAAILLVAYVVLVLGAYFALPPADLTVANAWQAVALVVLAFVLVLGGYALSLRSIHSARYPMVRSIVLLVVLLSTFIVFFSYVYLSLETRVPGSVPGLQTHLDGLYFTVTMLATVGFGDLTPSTQTARALATAQMVFNLVFLGALARTAVSVGRRERERRADSA